MSYSFYLIETFDLFPYTWYGWMDLKRRSSVLKGISSSHSFSPSLHSCLPSFFFLFFFLVSYISNCPDCVSSDLDITATPNLLGARGERGKIRLSWETAWISGPCRIPTSHLCFSLSLSLLLTFHSVPWKIYCNLADQRRASQSYSPNPVWWWFLHM